MKTKTNSVIYYLYFAAQKPVVAGIVDDIFSKNAGQTIYITEVFYPIQAITPLATMWGQVLPTTLYQVAYF